MFTHLDKLRLKQALEVIDKALKQPKLDELLERDLIFLHNSLKSLISSITIKQEGMSKHGKD